MTELSILALPRDPNPYQELLYSAMRARGCRVRYCGELTRSHTANLLLLPAELALLASRGYRVLHLHWTFAFAPPPPLSSRVMRRLFRGWFSFVLAWTGWFGLKLVWTAHNVLPHSPVFDDDVSARRSLLRRADLVIAHSSYAIDELSRRVAPPRRSVVIPHGPLTLPGITDDSQELPAVRTLVFFGKVERYKGVEDLLEAVRDLEGFRLEIAGACADDGLRRRLQEAAARTTLPVTLQLHYLAEPELAEVMRRASAFVFPFRTITTSGSIMAGMTAGRLCIFPDLEALRHLPGPGTLRYPSGVPGLRDAVRDFAARSDEQLVAAGAAARAASHSTSWDTIAAGTAAAMEGLFTT